jgi:hypothetical protein
VPVRRTHIVVEPPPSRFSAAVAPARICSFARKGSRVPIDQFVAVWRPSTVIRTKVQAVATVASAQPALVPTDVRGL